MYLYQMIRFRTFINKKPSEINLRNLYKKKYVHLHLCYYEKLGDEYQHIEDFYDYITNTWRD